MNYFCIQNTEALLAKILTPFLVAALTYFIFGKIDDLKKRKLHSILGKSVLSLLKNEIEKGLSEMSRVIFKLEKKEDCIEYNYLPNKTWSGVNTINDDVLLRILVLSGDKKDGFPLSEVRIHVKNYFEYIVANWNSHLKQILDNKSSFSELYRYKSYIEATTNVIKMLNSIIDLLDKNSHKIWPK